jgi:probable DNA metabolism protein
LESLQENDIMRNSKILIYDGSFNGFLSAVYKAFDERIQVADIQKNTIAQRGLFSDTETVFTQMDIAKSVWNGVQKKNHAAIKNIYFAFLSEAKGIELQLYLQIRKLFFPKDMLQLNFTDDVAIRISQLAKTVGREKKHMETTVDFQTTQDNLKFASISPDSDILPLISRHYRFLYNKQPWIIFDRKRNYGIYYNLVSVEIIALDNAIVSQVSDLKTVSVMPFITNKLHPQTLQREQPNFTNQRKAV